MEAVLMGTDFSLFENLSYERFKELAKDNRLDKIEKVGFPIEYRKGKESFILDDILTKLELNNREDRTVIDIGCGCSNLTQLLIDYCKTKSHKLILLDSEEMLSGLPDDKYIQKIAGYYPKTCLDFITEYKGKIDCILVYSVIQYVFTELSLFQFVDTAMSLLKEGGRILIGDIPNISKRKRFFSSDTGIKFHKNFIGKNEIPEVNFNRIETDCIDDSVVMSILQRCRLAGFDSYIMPQDSKLPMSNRREDILIVKP